MAEWGIRELRGTFPRLQDKIKWEEVNEKDLLIQLAILLFNY